MSNKKNRNNKGNQSLRASGVFKVCSRALDKKGRLRGKNKKETKYLKAICPHHRLSKKGAPIATFSFESDKNGNPYCVCKQCGTKFNIVKYNKNELKAVIKDTKEVIENCKFLASAVNSNPQVIDKLGEINVSMDYLYKTSKKLISIADSQENVKQNKHKNKHKNDNGVSMLSSWGPRRY